MFRRSLQDVRVKRGADVASDHHLVMSRLKLKLRRNEVDQEKRKGRYNVDYLKDQTIRKIQIRKYKKGAVNSSRTRAAKVAAQKEHTAANG